ncbi:nuclear transport factor 2 family protein [Streptomyces sp. UP1A-1]|nr:nuclear transport factor 2 family protein [Streptomyces sp. UP1A-1]
MRSTALPRAPTLVRSPLVQNTGESPCHHTPPKRPFAELLELLSAKDMDAVADLWAENGTAEFPFAEGASPRRLTGREAVRDYLA